MKSLSSLIHSAYFQSYLHQEGLVKTLTNVPVLSSDKLQEIGYSNIIANELRPILDVITQLEVFIIFLDDNGFSREELVEHVQDLQKIVRQNQLAVTLPFRDRINSALRQAKEQQHPAVPNDIRIAVIELEPDEFYEMSGREINECFKKAPKARLENLPFLFDHIQALDQLDTNLPFKELRTKAKSIIKQLKTL